LQFIKTTSVQVIRKGGPGRHQDTVTALAKIEGFDAHARSIHKRFE